MSYNPSEFKQHFPSIVAHLGSTGIEIFTRILVPTKATAGDVLISCGAKSDTLYLVWQGLLAISIEADSKNLLLGEVGDGSWVGKITMIEPGSATTTVIAKEDSTLLALSTMSLKQSGEDIGKYADFRPFLLSQSLSDPTVFISSHVSQATLVRVILEG